MEAMTTLRNRIGRPIAPRRVMIALVTPLEIGPIVYASRTRFRSACCGILLWFFVVSSGLVEEMLEQTSILPAIKGEQSRVTLRI
jgi:hypothetical protein